MEQKTTNSKNLEKATISKNKNLGFYKITTILLTVLSFILFLCLISNNSKKAITYNVTNLVPSYKDKENAFLSLPINHRLSNEGIIYYVDDENIKALCTMSCVEASEEDFNSAIKYYKENLNLKDQESINDFKVGKLIQEQNGIPFTYYFLYKDGLFNEFIFTGCDDETMLSILKGFNY